MAGWFCFGGFLVTGLLVFVYVLTAMGNKKKQQGGNQTPSDSTDESSS